MEFMEGIGEEDEQYRNRKAEKTTPRQAEAEALPFVPVFRYLSVLFVLISCSILLAGPGPRGAPLYGPATESEAADIPSSLNFGLPSSRLNVETTGIPWYLMLHDFAKVAVGAVVEAELSEVEVANDADLLREVVVADVHLVTESIEVIVLVDRDVVRAWLRQWPW